MASDETRGDRAPENHLAELDLTAATEVGPTVVGPRGPTRGGTGRYAGSRADRYDLLEVLGRGGMGVVYKVFDRELRRHVAMKVLRSDLGQDARLRDRFIEEAQATGQLEHRGIVPVHEIGRIGEGALFFTMKLVRGRTLAEVVAASRSSDPETRARYSLFRLLQVFTEVCRTIQFAHERGVIHRDLKPHNVMLGKHDDVQVMDWGLVKLLGEAARPWTAERPSREVELSTARDATQVGSLLGTPAYMAPEQAADGAEAATALSDVYALGAILFHLLTGRAPYEGTSTADLIARLQRDPPPRPRRLDRHIDRELEAICLRALAREPADRYPTAEALAADVQAFLENRPVSALPAGPLERLRKFVRREPLKAGLVAVLCLALLGMSSLALMLDRSVDQKSAALRASLVSDSLKTRALAERDASLAALAREYRQLADLSKLEDFDASLGRAHRDATARAGCVRELERFLGRAREHRTALAGLPRGEAVALGETLSVRQKRRNLEALLAGMEQLKPWLARLERGTAAHPEAAARWQAALAALAAPDGRYGGLEWSPTADLLPLGPDPDSGLEEFAHLWTGAVPVRGADGRWSPAEEHGVVFVLLPGGRFAMGAEDGDADERPMREVTLSPFLLAKHELTRAQWERIAGRDPSAFTNEAHGTDFLTRLQPVETVSWYEGSRLLTRLGLQLPSEAQWEYAARAGTTGPWSHGDTWSLAWGNTTAEPDGFDAFPAPVGTYPPNPWGLFEMHGNVWEFCADTYGPYPAGPARDPLRDEPGALYRTNRGGSWGNDPHAARSAFRGRSDPHVRGSYLGLRPARAFP